MLVAVGAEREMETYSHSQLATFITSHGPSLFLAFSVGWASTQALTLGREWNMYSRPATSPT